MIKYFDQIHLMTYDYHGGWETFTGQNSPLYRNPNIDLEGDRLYFNVNYSVNYFIEKGAPPSKIIMGMPLYGRGFTLRDPNQNGFYADAQGPIPAGPYVREDGNWGYNEICEKFASDNSWTIKRDPYYQSPYAYKGNLWIGYDDVESLKLKAQYAASMNLGGAMVWSIETDDFRGTCGEPYILIKTIHEALNGPIVRPTTPTEDPSKTTTIDPTAKTTVTIPTANPPSPVCTAGEGLYADPNDCKIFYQCISDGNGGYTIFTHSCASGTVFDASINTCTWPYLVPGCEGSGKYKTSP
jgi:chitinase